ncbi:MAG: SpoIIE family protein phosphatase, partial [Chloroflexi bacterium]|nr:SpoIIE family protein phosphatase [Chloroflexota bacterium]
RERAKLNGIALDLVSEFNRDEIFTRLTRSVAQLLGGDGAIVGLYDAQTRTVRYPYLYNCPVELMDDRVGLAGGMVYAVLQEHKPLLTNDYPSDPRAAKPFIEAGVKTTAIAPIAFRGHVIGAVGAIGYSEKVRFNRHSLELLTAVSRQVSIALENARLYTGLKESEKAAKKARRDVELLNNLALDITSGLDLAEVLYKVAKGATWLTDSERAVIAFYAEPWRGKTYGYNFPKEAVADLISSRVLTRPPVTETSIINDYPRSKWALESLVKFGTKAAIITPLTSHGRVVATLGVAAGKGRVFDQDDAQLLQGLARQAVIAIENATFFERERTIAETLQSSLLAPLPRLPGLEVEARYEPSGESAKVGGDFYDLFPVDHGLFGIVIGDVSGKGLEAATITAMAKNTIRAYALEDSKPGSVLQRSNKAVFRQTDPMNFITAFYGLLDAESGRLTYSVSGHPPAVLCRPHCGGEVLESGSLPLGIFAESRYPVYEIHLEPGSHIILYTDGLSEARRGAELFGEEGITRSLGVSIKAGKKLPQVVDALLDDAKDFAEGNLPDDIAILGILRKGR